MAYVRFVHALNRQILTDINRIELMIMYICTALVPRFVPRLAILPKTLPLSSLSFRGIPLQFRSAGRGDNLLDIIVLVIKSDSRNLL